MGLFVHWFVCQSVHQSIVLSIRNTDFIESTNQIFLIFWLQLGDLKYIKVKEQTMGKLIFLTKKKHPKLLNIEFFQYLKKSWDITFQQKPYIWEILCSLIFCTVLDILGSKKMIQWFLSFWSVLPSRPIKLQISFEGNIIRRSIIDYFDFLRWFIGSNKNDAKFFLVCSIPLVSQITRFLKRKSIKKPSS